MRIEEPSKMSNQEAADVLRKLQVIPSRCNGKSTMQLRIQVALAKAICALEKEEDRRRK